MTGTFLWQGRAIPFHPGETVAVALARAGVRAFDRRPQGGSHGIFCGIGLCQNCLVACGGRTTEACLLPCTDGLRVEPLGGDHA